LVNRSAECVRACDICYTQMYTFYSKGPGFHRGLTEYETSCSESGGADRFEEGVHLFAQAHSLPAQFGRGVHNFAGRLARF
jgi:hypothetical protein